MYFLAIILTVVYLVDGDTLDAVDPYGNKERIRIHGIDSDEARGPKRTFKGLEAKAFMDRWLYGKSIKCSPVLGTSISWGVKRNVRVCCHKGADIAAVLVNLDLATSDPEYDKAGNYSRPDGEYASSHCRVK